MPALLSPLLGWGLGVLFGLLPGRAPRRRGDELSDRRLVLIFACCVHAPAYAYFLAFAGDWSYAYLLAAAKVPSALELVFVACDAAAVVGGHRAARWCLPSAPRLATSLLLAGPPMLALLLGLTFGARLGIESTYERFQAGYGSEPLGTGPLLPALSWMGLLVLGGVVVCGASLRSTRWKRSEPAGPGPGGAWLGRGRGATTNLGQDR